MFKKLYFITIIFLGFITFAQSETSWIKKKDKSGNVEKTEETKTSSWIKKKKKIKENKKEYKKEEKKITKEVKTWIKKKTKDNYIVSISDLPKGAIYFQATNASRTSLIYGYVLPDTSSKLINGFYETSKGFGYFNDGKTTCKVGSTVRFASSSGEVLSQISGECTNGLKFTGRTSQMGNEGSGSAETADGKERYFVDVHTEKIKIAKLYDKNLSYQNLVAGGSQDKKQKDIKFKPDGKYYALLIGNSKYSKWTSLTSPKKDVDGIYKALNENYDFEKIFKVNDASRSDIFDAFSELIKISTDNDYVLIYYSGHGERTENQAYWIPVDSEKDWGGSWINTSDIHVAISKIQAKHILLMSDSCYVGTAFKGDNDEVSKKEIDFDTKLLRNNFKQRSRWFISSGGNSQVMDEVVKGHSLFAYKLIDLLKNEKKYLSTASIYNQINRYNSQFIFEGGYNQSPVIGTVSTWGHLGGDFIFIPKKNLQ